MVSENEDGAQWYSVHRVLKAFNSRLILLKQVHEIKAKKGHVKRIPGHHRTLPDGCLMNELLI